MSKVHFKIARVSPANSFWSDIRATLAKSPFDTLVLFVARQADKPEAFEEIDQFWSSIHDLTGDKVLFAVLDGTAHARYNPFGQQEKESAKPWQDWQSRHSLHITQIRRRLVISEGQVPAFFVADRQHNKAYTIPFAYINTHFEGKIYPFLKSLVVDKMLLYRQLDGACEHGDAIRGKINKLDVLIRFLQLLVSARINHPNAFNTFWQQYRQYLETREQFSITPFADAIFGMEASTQKQMFVNAASFMIESIMATRMMSAAPPEFEAAFHHFYTQKVELNELLHSQVSSVESIRPEENANERQATDIPAFHISTERVFAIPSLGISFRLEPQKAAFYALLLQHPEGIRYNDLEQHRTTLLDLYAQMSGAGNHRLSEKKAQAYIDSLLHDPDYPVQCKSKINAAIKKAFQRSGHDATPYLIAADRSSKTAPALLLTGIASTPQSLEWQGFKKKG